MKYRWILLVLMAVATAVPAQSYRFSFTLQGRTDETLYMARHYRDELQIVDSARRGADGTYLFQGSRCPQRGIYALVDGSRGKAIGDFCVDGSRRFSIVADEALRPASVRVKGCPMNERMFGYQRRLAEARERMDAIRKRKQEAATRAEAERDEAALNAEMEAYEASMRDLKKPGLYLDLVNRFSGPDVPDTVQDKPRYYRAHYWDGVFGPQADGLANADLIYTPQLYNKLNYFFFGLLYYADSDTIIKEVDRLMQRTAGDTAMQQYIMEHITPRYYRSTKNVGWDAVWCHLAGQYYLQGRCPWATEGTVYNMRYNYDRIRQSIIGAHGQELWMADTNQSNNPKDWISSHRFPERYVILWFWDPDCHHCQEQTAQLKTLYDSLRTTPDRRFEVYAVGYESDVDKWKRYVREHRLPFVNVGGTNVNIDYQEAYNVHGAPTMVILNERRDIIMNKVLPVGSLLRFLDEYEKKHPAPRQ